MRALAVKYLSACEGRIAQIHEVMEAVGIPNGWRGDFIIAALAYDPDIVISGGLIALEAMPSRVERLVEEVKRLRGILEEREKKDV